MSTETITGTNPQRNIARQPKRAPTVIVERRGDEEAEVVARLQVAGAHLSTIFRPRLGDVGAGHRPLAAHADAGEQAKRAELPDVLRERGGAGEERVDEDRRRERARASEAVGDRPPEERKAPPDEKHREENRADESDARGDASHSRARQQLGERRREHQRVDHRVHAVEQPAGPRGPEADDLLSVELRFDCRRVERHASSGHWFTGRPEASREKARPSTHKCAASPSRNHSPSRRRCSA